MKKFVIICIVLLAIFVGFNHYATPIEVGIMGLLGFLLGILEVKDE